MVDPTQQRQNEARARRELEDMSRRWPLNPRFYQLALIVALLVILLLAFF